VQWANQRCLCAQRVATTEQGIKLQGAALTSDTALDLQLVTLRAELAECRAQLAKAGVQTCGCKRCGEYEFPRVCVHLCASAYVCV